MAKARNTVFFCSECGYESARWLGQCPACKAWNTFVEEPAAKKEAARAGGGAKLRPAARTKPAKLSEISIMENDRTSTGFAELDRVLGGGLVAGSLLRDRQINAASAGLPEAGRGREEGSLYLRRGVTQADQAAGQPDRGNHGRTFVPLRDQSGCGAGDDSGSKAGRSGH